MQILGVSCDCDAEWLICMSNFNPDWQHTTIRHYKTIAEVVWENRGENNRMTAKIDWILEMMRH